MCLAVTHAASPQQTATKENQTQNKTKRGLTEQTHTFHDVDSFKPLVLYPELAAAAGSHGDVYAAPSALTAFESEPPKQVTAQQVLYEYQQTPSTTISNVHVNQQFQTVPNPETANSHVVYASQLPPASATQFTNDDPNLEAQQNQQSLSVHNVVHPVQHSSLIKHGQNYGQVSYQPSGQGSRSPATYTSTRNQQQPAPAAPSPAPINHQYVSQSVQPTQSSFYGTTQHFPQQQQQHQQQQHHQQQLHQQHHHQQQNPFAQGKYLYVNGKILYYPQGIQTTPLVPPATYPGTITKHPAISYQHHPPKPVVSAQKPQRRPVAPTPTPTPTPTLSAVQYYNSYVPKKIIPTTTKALVQAPTPAPVKETPREEKEEEEEEEPEEKPQLRPIEEDDEEEEEEEDDRPIRYHNQEEEDDDEEEEEPTKYVPKYYKSKYLYSPSNDEIDEYDEVDDDSEREPSKQVKQKTKTPKKYYKGDVYLKPTKEKNGYKNSKYFVFFDPLKEDPKKTAYVSSDSEPKHTRTYASYKKPQKKTKARKSKVTTTSEEFEEPQMEYSVYKYHKVEPRKEDLLEREIEGRYSENVPVIHTQKVIKKQWLVTKTDSR